MEIPGSNNRIRELDFARGLALLCMMVVHFYYCGERFGGWTVHWTDLTNFVNEHCGGFFMLLSGITANFGRRNIKRGLTVLACGFLLTALSSWLYVSGRESADVLYQWGALHCIGCCMLLYGLIKKLPPWARIVLGAVMVAAGYYLYFEERVINPWLFPLGLRPRVFGNFDYKPLLPFGGWFVLGCGLGSIVYKDKKPLFPKLRFAPVEWVGRNSLLIYTVHLPVYYILFKTVFWRGL